MGFKDHYNRWSIGRQLQAYFIISCFFITLILVVITRFQLDWLRNKIIDDSTQAIEKNLITQLRDLGEMEARYMGAELSNYGYYVKNLDLIERMLYDCERSGYLIACNEIQWNDELGDEKNKDNAYKGAFYQPNEKNSYIYEILKMDTPIDSIYQYIFSSDYLRVYQGFHYLEYVHYFPRSEMPSSDYSPIVREWYYYATDRLDEIIITEPYKDVITSQWVISVSAAMPNDTKHTGYIGVAACDIPLSSLDAKISSVQIQKTRFILLISSGGMILSMPDSWKPTETTSTIRIFDSEYTGINELDWSIIKNLTSGSRYEFTDINGTNIIMIKQDILPETNSNAPTHHLFLCIPRSEFSEIIDSIRTSFSKVYTKIFLIALCFAVCVLIIVVTMIYFVTRESGKQMLLVEKLFRKIIRQCLFTKMAKAVYFTKLEKNSKGIETLIEICREKVMKIKSKEKKFNYYKWGNTRPGDLMIYDNWMKCLYPRNLFSHKEVSWRGSLHSLKNVFGY